jgi:hypothetical protein
MSKGASVAVREGEGNRVVHPARFNGEFSLVFRGRHHPRRGNPGVRHRGDVLPPIQAAPGVVAQEGGFGEREGNGRRGGLGLTSGLRGEDSRKPAQVPIGRLSRHKIRCRQSTS